MTPRTTTPSATGALAQLVTFATRRVRRSPREYGEGLAGYRAYRQESRRITRDLHRFTDALAVAYQVGVTNELLVALAPQTFSGRLKWQEGDWDYTPGQYFPTEYRKAACALLDAAIQKCKQAVAHPLRTLTATTTVADVRAWHEQTGSYWFDPCAMRFFHTRIHTHGPLIQGRYFITSEQQAQAPEHARRYSIREVLNDGHIRTVGRFCEFSTYGAAKAQATCLTGDLLCTPTTITRPATVSTTI